MRCSEPGGSVAVAVVASRTPGRWYPLRSYSSGTEETRQAVPAGDGE